MWRVVLICLAGAAGAEVPLQSACIALAGAPAQVVPVGLGAPLTAESLRIRFLGHASFALETAAGVLAITDYTGFIGNPDVVPDVVTMNIAHDTHFTDDPDPRIPLVLRGWGPVGLPARIDEEVGDLRIRNVTSDLRGPFGEGARKDGNSIFIFEAAGLCIGHLGHLHQVPSPAQYGAIGRLDVVMVPVDGGYTMRPEDIAAVIRHFRARLVLPMHWFTEKALVRFMSELGDDFEVIAAGGPEVVISRQTLPLRPTVLLLEPSPLP